ncbi:hypothetical protein Hesp080 [Hemileuca sp. nucleopolyhedrovirus]|uniref:Uncharacterized protein n=1 Tax=Hemileuca sp. nucleopolyhedrovirus TaxID=1367203 RepID=S5N9B0_9ABAC|nr:hypothetical protein Hesp080 [Hemileuca sp. nucleopolyhedrovirus]AGR56832.1 hypothetical protein Hesp080 [Hemileuca sp. nucleopolyhedrovirus]
MIYHIKGRHVCVKFTSFLINARPIYNTLCLYFYCKIKYMCLCLYRNYHFLSIMYYICFN